jgi:large subunit ribosomal protein L4
MASVPVLNQSGKKAGTRELPSEWFEAPVNGPLMHQVVVAGMAAIRRGTHSTKTRAEVRGGGRKPWRQKGTGRARHGSNRSPIWTGGGIAHGPKPRDHSMRVNKKMKRQALRSALSDAVQSGKVALVDALSFEEPSTRGAAEILETLELSGKVLVVIPRPDQVIEKSFRNIPTVMVTYARSVPVYALLEADRVLFTAGAVDVLEVSAETEPDEREQADETETSGDESQAEAGEADEADEQDQEKAP